MVVAEIFDGFSVYVPRLLKTDDVGVNLVYKLDDSLSPVQVADAMDIIRKKTENDGAATLDLGIDAGGPKGWL